MASGSQLMTTYYAKRIVGDASAAQANSALLQTGAGIAVDTWILNRTNRADIYGIKYVYDTTTTTIHNDENDEDITTNNGQDKIEFYGGSATASAWIQLNTGDITAHKFIGALEGNATTATTASYLSAPAAAGYITDESGNFTHKRTTTSDYWHLNKNNGSAVLSVYWENGNVSATGTVTAAGFAGPLTGNVTGNCSGSSGSCTGNAATSTSTRYVQCPDTRSTNPAPSTFSAANGVSFDFKQGSVIGLTSANYSGVMSFRPYASGTDWSGGNAHQLAFNNAGLYWRQGGSDWGNWTQIVTNSGTWSISITGNAATATKLATARNLTIGATAKTFDGTVARSWSMNEIMGSSDSTKFYRGDKTWSNTIVGAFNASSSGSNRANINMITVADQPNDFYLGNNNASKWSITSRASNESYNLNIYSTASGVSYCTRWEYSTGKFYMLHGAEVSGGGLEIKGHIAGDSGTSGHGLYSGGAYHNAYNNIILQGDATTGSSGIAFVSSKGTTSINQPSDRAFIQFHAYGVTTYTAEGTAPTLATSGEANVLVIGVGNDAADTVRLQTPGRTGLLHQVANNAYVIPDTNNTTGSVGGTTTPVYIDGGVIKTCTAYASASVNYATSSGSSASCTGNAATATRINGNLVAATSNVDRNIWVSSTASADGIPNYISGFNMNPSTKVFTVPAGTRISPNTGALYLGNSGNQNWVYVQDMCGQDGQKWKIHQNGNAEFTGTVTATKFSGPLTGNVTGNCSGSAGSVAWGNVTGKPSTFAPSTHTHNSLVSLGRTTPETGRTCARGGLYSYGTYNAANMPHNYCAVVGFGTGTSGHAEIAVEWTSGVNMWVRSLRDTTDNWFAWKQIWTKGNSLTSAVWNDYAEARQSSCIEPGRTVSEVGDDTLKLVIERLAPCAGIVSDTWGFSQGETTNAKTHIAVAGRVLAYPYRDRNEYKPGDVLCAAPGGTVDIMTREEIIQYPDRIVGTVSCVPTYEEWGGGEGADRPPVKVNGRIWVKVK